MLTAAFFCSMADSLEAQNSSKFTAGKVSDIHPQGWLHSARWFTLDGRRLNGKPSEKGVYINNGIKIIIK